MLDLNEYLDALVGEGPLAHQWSDKPHRLVYDLIKEIERLRQEATQPADYTIPADLAPSTPTERIIRSGQKVTPEGHHTVWCRCDGRGIIPGPHGQAIRCPEMFDQVEHDNWPAASQPGSRPPTHNCGGGIRGNVRTSN